MKGAYSLLLNSNTDVPWYKFVWKAFLPPSSSTLCWRFIHGHIPTDDILQFKGIYTTLWCSLYRRISESISHLFLTSPFSIIIWQAMENLFGKSIYMSGNVEDLIVRVLKRW